MQNFRSAEQSAPVIHIIASLTRGSFTSRTMEVISRVISPLIRPCLYLAILLSFRIIFLIIFFNIIFYQKNVKIQYIGGKLTKKDFRTRTRMRKRRKNTCVFSCCSVQLSLTGALFGRSSRYVGRLCRSSIKKSSGISGISEYKKIPTGIMK